MRSAQLSPFPEITKHSSSTTSIERRKLLSLLRTQVRAGGWKKETYLLLAVSS